MKVFSTILLVLLVVSLTCAKRRKRIKSEVLVESDEADTLDVTSYLEADTGVPELATGLPEQNTRTTLETTGEPQQATETHETTTEVLQATETLEQTTGVPEQTSETHEPTIEVPQATETLEQTTGVPGQTNDEPEQATEKLNTDAAVQNTEPTTGTIAQTTAIMPTSTTSTPTSKTVPETTLDMITTESTTDIPKTTTLSSQATDDQPDSELERAEGIVNASVGKPGGRPQNVGTPKYGFEVGLFINDGKKFCGGALLDKDWVITAASCLPPNSEVIAVLGLQYRYQRNASKNHSQIHLVNNYAVHEANQAKNRKNDIALLKLARSANIDNEYIKPIRLPKLSQVLPHGMRATSLGFGKTYTGKVSPVLREGRSNLLPKSICQLRYLFSTLHDTNICLSGLLATGFCKGDVGGPLLSYEMDKEPTLIGINSFVGGLGCSLGWPIVFTQVSPYVGWISRVTGIPIRY